MREYLPLISAITNLPTATDYAQLYILAIGGTISIGGLALPVRSPTSRLQPTMLSAVFWPSAAYRHRLGISGWCLPSAPPYRLRFDFLLMLCGSAWLWLSS